MSGIHNHPILHIMRLKAINIATGGDNPNRSLYDPEPTADDDLWFLQGPDEAEDDAPGAAPLPRAKQQSLIDLAAWQASEADLAAPLAQLASRLGALDERLRRAPDGWRQRLAMIEAAGLSWLTAERITVERLSLWQAMRLSGVQEDNRALLRTGWAYRRLSSGPIPATASPDEVMQFLGRQDPHVNDGSLVTDDVTRHEERVSDHVANWCAEMSGAADLHPITQAVFGRCLWGPVGLSDHIVEADFEATVLAARLSVAGLTGGAMFLPLAGGGALTQQRGGTAEDQLRRFIDGAGAATLSSLRHLDHLEDWQRRATVALTKCSGRTPRLLLKLFVDWPLVSAPMAEAKTGTSRAAVQRNLNVMGEMGLIREITGQGRYRLWVAAM